jgi:hypothetical protein
MVSVSFSQSVVISSLSAHWPGCWLGNITTDSKDWPDGLDGIRFILSIRCYILTLLYPHRLNFQTEGVKVSN